MYYLTLWISNDWTLPGVSPPLSSGSHAHRPGPPGQQPAAHPHAQPHQAGEDSLQLALSAARQQIQGTVCWHHITEWSLLVAHVQQRKYPFALFQVILQFLLCTALFGSVGAIVDMNSESWLLKGILLACAIGVMNLATRWRHVSTELFSWLTCKCAPPACFLFNYRYCCLKQEFPDPSLSSTPTTYSPHGFSLLDARHLVPLVPAWYPLFKENITLQHSSYKTDACVILWSLCCQ